MNKPLQAKPDLRDRETLEKGLPYIRSVVAFLIYLRGCRSPNGVAPTIELSYGLADKFIAALDSDLQ